MKLSMPKFIVKLTGDIYLFKFPMWFSYKPSHHKVKGFQVRRILDLVHPGDILLRRYNGYLNTFFTPGFWGHAALYVGDNNIIHAVGEGVIEEDILDFSRCDSVCLLRPRVEFNEKNDAITKAINLKNNHTQYDYKFQANNGTVYCTELVDTCYNNIFCFDYNEIAGNKILLPDGIYKSKKVDIILSIEY